MANFFSALTKSESAVVPYQPTRSAPRSELEVAVRNREAELLSIEGVEGISAAQGHVVVYVRDASVKKLLPSQLGGFEVEAVITGTIRAY